MAGLPAHSGEQERPRPAFSYPSCGLGAHLIQAGQQIESSSDPEDQGTQQEINRQNAHTPRLGIRAALRGCCGAPCGGLMPASE